MKGLEEGGWWKCKRLMMSNSKTSRGSLVGALVCWLAGSLVCCLG